MSNDKIRLLIAEDSAHPAGGHALLYLRGATRLPPDSVLALRRLTPPEAFLGPNGWQPAEALLSVERMEQDQDGTPLLHLGPGIVNRIAPHLKIEIAIPSLGLRQTVIWPVLAQSPEEFLPTAGRVAGGAPGRRKAVVPPPPPPDPEPEPPAPEPTAPVVAPPVTPRFEPIRESEEDFDDPKPKHRLWPWLLLLVVLIGGGLTVWQLLTDEPRRLLCAWGVLDCQASVCPDSLPAREHAACLIGDIGPDESFALAEQLGGSGDAAKRNLAWILLDALSRVNYAPAYLELGLCFDPLLPDGCSLRPRLSANARQALDSYKHATTLGSADAGLYTDKLCEWLGQQVDLQSQATANEFCR